MQQAVAVGLAVHTGGAHCAMQGHQRVAHGMDVVDAQVLEVSAVVTGGQEGQGCVCVWGGGGVMVMVEEHKRSKHIKE